MPRHPHRSDPFPLVTDNPSRFLLKVASLWPWISVKTRHETSLFLPSPGKPPSTHIREPPHGTPPQHLPKSAVRRKRASDNLRQIKVREEAVSLAEKREDRIDPTRQKHRNPRTPLASTSTQGDENSNANADLPLERNLERLHLRLFDPSILAPATCDRTILATYQTWHPASRTTALESDAISLSRNRPLRIRRPAQTAQTPPPKLPVHRLSPSKG